MDVRAKAMPAAAPTRPHVAGAEERYHRFMERLEETRQLIAEHARALGYEAAQMLPRERLLQEKQFANACGILVRWVTEEITSPMPRGRGGLERDDNSTPLRLMMML